MKIYRSFSSVFRSLFESSVICLSWSDDAVSVSLVDQQSQTGSSQVVSCLISQQQRQYEFILRRVVRQYQISCPLTGASTDLSVFLFLISFFIWSSRWNWITVKREQVYCWRCSLFTFWISFFSLVQSRKIKPTFVKARARIQIRLQWIYSLIHLKCIHSIDFLFIFYLFE